MILLTKLSVLYEQSKDLDRQNRVVDEIEKIVTEYSNIMDQAKEYLYNRKEELQVDCYCTIKSKKTSTR